MRIHIALTVLVAAVALVGCSSASGLDNTSPEYQDGWNREVQFDLHDKYGPNTVVNECTVGLQNKKNPHPDSGYVHMFEHWDYNDHQRKEWAHGCVDAERNLTDYKVPQQSWEK